MVVGENCKGNGVVCLIPGAEAGFLPCEAAFLVSLIKSLGVSTLFFGAVGASLKETTYSVFILNDGVDVTTMRACASDATPTEFLALEAFNKNNLICNSDSFPTASYFQFTGPAPPTPAEQNFAVCGSADIIGISSL